MFTRSRVKAACLASALIGLAGFGVSSCSGGSSNNSPAAGATGQPQACQFVQSGYGPTGTVNVKADKLVTGLEVPWGIAFLPDGNILVTERPGRIRLVRGGSLVSSNVATVQIGETSEGGLLGIALDPHFASNRYFYVYYTTDKNGATVNRVQRFVLSPDETQATADKILVDDIASGTFHDGGRIKFGPDGMLYVSVGDGTGPNRAQDPASPNGKILRLTSEGQVPPDNPVPGQPGFVLGVRNSEGFDWLNPSTMVITDHGPTGELGRTGADEVNIAHKGDNLGWPTIYQCQTQPGLVSPILSWNDPTPPGGAVIYQGDNIPEWKGDLLIGVLGVVPGGAMHLHRVMFAKDGSGTMIGHEVYFEGTYGRLRDVVQGPDGALYVTTSNCDSRGACPADKDVILRVHHG